MTWECHCPVVASAQRYRFFGQIVVHSHHGETSSAGSGPFADRVPCSPFLGVLCSFNCEPTGPTKAFHPGSSWRYLHYGSARGVCGHTIAWLDLCGFLGVGFQATCIFEAGRWCLESLALCHLNGIGGWKHLLERWESPKSDQTWRGLCQSALATPGHHPLWLPGFGAADSAAGCWKFPERSGHDVLQLGGWSHGGQVVESGPLRGVTGHHWGIHLWRLSSNGRGPSGGRRGSIWGKGLRCFGHGDGFWDRFHVFVSHHVDQTALGLTFSEDHGDLHRCHGLWGCRCRCCRKCHVTGSGISCVVDQAGKSAVAGSIPGDT